MNLALTTKDFFVPQTSSLQLAREAFLSSFRSSKAKVFSCKKHQSSITNEETFVLKCPFLESTLPWRCQQEEPASPPLSLASAHDSPFLWLMLSIQTTHFKCLFSTTNKTRSVAFLLLHFLSVTHDFHPLFFPWRSRTCFL